MSDPGTQNKEGIVKKNKQSLDAMLRKLKAKWEMACTEYETAWTSATDSNSRNVSCSDCEKDPVSALTELISVKNELDGLVAKLGKARRQRVQSPFIVGIINLPGSQHAV
jgi:hypothetical protein